MIVSAKKDKINYYGQIPKIASMIGVNSQTIRRWMKDGKDEVLTKNGYLVCLNNKKVF